MYFWALSHEHADHDLRIVDRDVDRAAVVRVTKKNVIAASTPHTINAGIDTAPSTR